jgi:hypothetical protein
MTEILSESERDKFQQSIQDLERRLARLERHVGLPRPDAFPESGGVPRADGLSAADKEAALEQNIGEFGLAWAGSIVFLLGIGFLTTFTMNQGYSLLSACMGFAAAAGLFFLARAWQGSYLYLSRILVSASLILGYYTSLRLHHFSVIPLVTNPVLATALLLLFSLPPLALALQAGSQVLAGLSIVLCLLSAALTENVHIALVLVTLQAMTAVVLALRRNWWRILDLSILLGYLTHLIWLFLYSVPSRVPGSGEVVSYPLAYLFIAAIVYCWPTLSFDSDADSDAAHVGVVVLNCLGFSGVLILAGLALFPRDFAMPALAACTLFILCSVGAWRKTRLQFAATAYACFGYVALSVAIYGFVRGPEVFLWLALQSFVVVSMALWFRSRVLVVVNALIYFAILAGYSISEPMSVSVNFGLALVALLSARVMNWKKERLTLRTDGLRIVYLGATFIMVLYSLYHAVPPSFVALSWTATAVGYFLLSVWLKNVKYRWMSLLTLLATVGYLILVDMARLDPKLRVVAFLCIGLMAVGISIFYAKLRQPGGKNKSKAE